MAMPREASRGLIFLGFLVVMGIVISIGSSRAPTTQRTEPAKETPKPVQVQEKSTPFTQCFWKLMYEFRNDPQIKIEAAQNSLSTFDYSGLKATLMCKHLPNE